MTEFITELPGDLSRHIFEDHMINISECDEFLGYLQKNRELDLDFSKIEGVVEKLLDSPLSIDYLCSKQTCIRICYTQHYVEKNHTGFALMSKLHSFIASILFYMHH
tara:strand:- start:1017 stop:1337 length:321 start_codon:yes stop_codon:yes gene_type:complete